MKLANEVITGGKDRDMARQQANKNSVRSCVRKRGYSERGIEKTLNGWRIAAKRQVIERCEF